MFNTKLIEIGGYKTKNNFIQNDKNMLDILAK